MNKELILEKANKLSETLSDPKMVSGLVGLGICAPILLPSLIQSFPVLAVISAKCGTITAVKVSSLLMSGGFATLGGVTGYITIDTLRNLLDKEEEK